MQVGMQWKQLHELGAPRVQSAGIWYALRPVDENIVFVRNFSSHYCLHRETLRGHKLHYNEISMDLCCVCIVPLCGCVACCRRRTACVSWHTYWPPTQSLSVVYRARWKQCLMVVGWLARQTLISSSTSSASSKKLSGQSHTAQPSFCFSMCTQQNVHKVYQWSVDGARPSIA